MKDTQRLVEKLFAISPRYGRLASGLLTMLVGFAVMQEKGPTIPGQGGSSYGEEEGIKAEMEKIDREFAMKDFFSQLNKDLGNRPPGRVPGTKRESPNPTPGSENQ